MVPDFQPNGHWFDSWLQYDCVTTQASCSYTCASVTKQYNLVPANRRWCSAAGQVIISICLVWLGGQVLREPDLQSTGLISNCAVTRSRVRIPATPLSSATLGKLLRHMCLCHHGEVTAGLVESNGSLPPGLWLRSPVGWLLRTGISSGTKCLYLAEFYLYTYAVFTTHQEH